MTTRRIDFELEDGWVAQRCRSCGEEIVWVVTGNSVHGKAKRMPLDLSTAVRGLDGINRAESHFAHCPQASDGRRR